MPDLVWPHGIGPWYDLVLLLFLTCFKLDRGRTMLQRSTGRIDRLGASFIASDFVIGFAYGIAAAWTVYPPLAADGWAHWIVRTVVTVVLGWAWALMRRAEPARISKAAGDD